MINYHINQAQRLIFDKYLHIFIIVFFEFIGTMLFAYSNLNLINLKAQATLPGEKIVYDILDFSLSMFMCISYTRQFSGGMYNPAVAIFRAIRRTDRFPVKISLCYIISQFFGAISGSFIALYLNNVSSAPIKSWLPFDTQMKNLGTEMIGSFVMTFMVQLIIEKQMTFIEHNRQFYICIPLYYIVARTYSASFNCINPAFGLGFELVWCVRQCFTSECDWDPLAMSYIIIIGSVLGALISVFAFQCMFRPLFPIKKQIAQTLQKYRKEKEHIQLREVEKMQHIKNTWSLGQIISDDLIPAVGDQYTYGQIKNQDIDDSISSDEEEQNSFSFTLELSEKKFLPA